ncbi:MAG: PstS family phosphate ABC transporter substrate-binding protein [Clostridia bacterium]|nr:PstS family phosphate ABC transporter substrate-binding protein [Clostridia bacterium]
MNKLLRLFVTSVVVMGLALTAACGSQQTSEAPKAEAPKAEEPKKDEKKLSGKIVIDGSSTVYPISAAIAEEFKKAQGGVEVSVALSGTGGGMKKFAAGEIDICDASRPIKKEEAEKAKANGIDFVEFTVAYDGISVVVNKDSKIDSITTAELKKIWEKDSKVKKWNEVNPAWPDSEIKLYGPGTDSGTFEFFTEAINHKAKESRTDYTPSEDDNVLVQGIAGDKSAMGYFGYAYYEENKDKLKLLKIDGGKGAIAPSFDSIKDGSYAPLSRPLFIYVSTKAMEQPHVKEFVKFYLTKASEIVKDVKYVPLSDYSKELAKIK